MEEVKRKLASIQRVDEINPIPNADNIEVLSIQGWKVVSQKGNFQPGDLAVYFQIDSFMREDDPRFSFLMKAGIREMDGIKGHKLRTVKLRGQLSQGLALPLKEFSDILPENYSVDTDLTDILGIKKYEGPSGLLMSGQIKGPFPSLIRKTDQERCQNFRNEIFEENKDSKYEVSLKLDGSSVTYYHFEGEVGACSRNLELKINEENKDNTIIKLFMDSGLFDKDFSGFAIQGELCGPKIQDNREKFQKHKLFVFDIQDIKRGEYLTPSERIYFMNEMLWKRGVDKNLIDHVPILHNNVTLNDLGITNMDQLLAFAEGPSIVHPIREGVVFKRVDGKFSFKSINNTFLLKEK